MLTKVEGQTSRLWTLGHVLRRCHQANIAIWTSAFGSAPTAPQYAVLSVVAAVPEADMQLVGAIAGLEKTTLTGVTHRLERDGWVQRTPDARDLRRRRLTLTEPGRLALQQTAASAAAAHAEFLSPIAASDHDRLRRHLRDLGRVAFDQPPSAEAAGIWRELMTAPGHLIRRAQQAHAAHWLAEFGQGLTGPQYAVLRVLAVDGETTHTRLGELAALDKATLSGVVDRLVRRGLLSSRPDAFDRRSRLLTLTDAGKELEHSARPRVRRVQTQTAAPIAEVDRPWLWDALEQLAFRAEAAHVDLDGLSVDAR